MQTELMDIFKLRANLLKRTDPDFYKENEYQIKQSSLAAQDYYLSGNYSNRPRKQDFVLFQDIPEYNKVHTKYHLDFNMLIANNSNYIDMRVIMFLTQALSRDIKNKIISEYGQFFTDSYDDIYRHSKVLYIAHESFMKKVAFSKRCISNQVIK